MIRTEVDGRTYYIKFAHTRLSKPHLWGDEHLISAVTICSLQDDDYNELGFGVARCSISDIFNKETGRKLALARALKECDKSTRCAVWDAYWLRH